VFFDDMCLRALPVIPLIIYRLIENDATETAERLLMVYAPLIFYHPTRFSFVRDTLAYFYGHLPTKLVRRLLSSMDLAKVSNSGFSFFDACDSHCVHWSLFCQLHDADACSDENADTIL
jgi:hypothetical protein